MQMQLEQSPQARVPRQDKQLLEQQQVQMGQQQALIFFYFRSASLTIRKSSFEYFDTNRFFTADRRLFLSETMMFLLGGVEVRKSKQQQRHSKHSIDFYQYNIYAMTLINTVSLMKPLLSTSNTQIKYQSHYQSSQIQNILMASYQIAYILERQKLYRFQYLSTYGRSAYMQKLNTVENQSQREQQPKNGRRDQYIGTFQELPEFLKDNENITDGYRINFNTPRQIMRSLFMIHNETVNIWTHCITGLAIISFLLYFFVIIHQQNKAIQSYQDTMGTGINYYMNALDNLQTISDHERQKSEAKMKEVKEEANNNFQQFINLMQKSKNDIENSIQSQFNQIKSNIKQILRNNLVQFQKIKIQFENKIAPMFVKEMDESFDRNQWLKQIKKYVIKLKERLDSEDFEQFELNIKKDNPQSISRWPIFVFLASALFCLTASTIFHLFYPMNLKVYTVTHRCDYAGISILICGSVFPPFYYGLYCTVNVAIFYLTISILLAIFTFLVCLFQWIHKPEHKVYKSLLFTGYGLTYIFPVSHIFINEFIYDNYGDPFQFMSSFVYIFLLGTSYYVGLYIYTIRCPERSNPGKYNICGHSHQIWHGFSIMGMIFTYLMAIESFEMRKMSQCPA